MPASAVTKLLDLPFYTEGPVVDARGDFFFTTLAGNQVYRLNAEAGPVVWATGICPNGQAVGRSGRHWFCHTQAPGIGVYDADGVFLGYQVLDRCAGQKVHAPNDLVLDNAGNLYFTDSVRHHGKVFFKSEGGAEILTAANIDYANGLVLAADEKRIYVAESYLNRILVVELGGPGMALRRPEVFAALPVNPSGRETGNLPDGLAVDGQGRLWVAHYGMGAVQVLNSSGEHLFTVETELPLTSNLCFVEDLPGKQTLLVTGGYAEPGPGALMLLTVVDEPHK